MSLKVGVHYLATDAKTALIAATGTTGAGIGTLLDLIPNDIGKLATLVGIVLTGLLCWSHFLNIQRSRIELRMLKAQEQERLEKSAARAQAGLPTRREDDVITRLPRPTTIERQSKDKTS